MKLIDFDEMFDKSLEKILKKQLGKVKPETIESSIPSLYESWLNMKNAEIGGLTPKEFVNRLKAENKLGRYILAYAENDMEISDLIAEAAGEEEVPSILEMIEKYPSYKQVGLKMIGESGSTAADGKLVEMLTDEESEDVKDIIVEVLSSGHENVCGTLLDMMEGADEETRKLFVDILYHYTGDRRIFDWLVKMFATTDEIALYAAYLGAYGDEDAVEILKKYADENKLTHYEFLEIRNAVERLGGEMDGEYDVESR